VAVVGVFCLVDVDPRALFGTALVVAGAALVVAGAALLVAGAALVVAGAVSPPATPL
jgi:hypothetical protein